MYQKCNVKGDACSDEYATKFHPVNWLGVSFLPCEETEDQIAAVSLLAWLAIYQVI